MSNIGISIAGSVAQGSIQVQQVSRATHRQATDASAEARQIRDRLDAHVAALDEGDETNSISQLRIDEQMPERSPHDPEHEARDEAQNEMAKEDSPVPADGPMDDASPSGGSEHAYRPLDITA